VFVANTHTPIVFFSSKGVAYKLKTYKLPLGNPQARGKAMVNLLPLDPGETISTVMPLPEDESKWGDLHAIFATERGGVRRNLLSDFTDIRANGKIAMKFEGEDEGDKLIGVQVCTDADDILLAARNGKCTRFPVADVRVFSGRNSTGVRGMKLEDGDRVIGMSILRHAEFDAEIRDAFFRKELATELAATMAAQEEHILTISENGYGKRSSAYEYRVSGRGGSGIYNMDVTGKTGPVVASFRVAEGDEIILATNAGKVIRIPTDGVRVAGRQTQGVTLVRTEDGEVVVSAARLTDVGAAPEANGEGNGGAGEAEEPTPIEPPPEDSQAEPGPDEGEGGSDNKGGSGGDDA